MKKHYKILVIDDEPGIRELLSRELVTHGYRVEAAANGQEALEKIEPGKYQVALCDLNMPKLGGLEAMEGWASPWEPQPVAD